MSLKAMLWAMNESPAENPTEVAVLMALGDNAREDGTGACPGLKKIAARARVSERTAQRTLRALESRGLIYPGDQSIAAYLGRYAPVVYDLAMHLKRDDLADDVDLYDGGPERRQAVDNQGRQVVTPEETAGQEARQSVTPALPNPARGDTRGARGVTAVSPKPSNKPTTPVVGVSTQVQVSAAPVENPPKIRKGTTATAPRPGWDEFGPLSPKCAEHVGVDVPPSCRSCGKTREAFEKAELNRAAARRRAETKQLLDEQNRNLATRRVDGATHAARARAELAARRGRAESPSAGSATPGQSTTPDDPGTLFDASAEQLAGAR